jgi:hypothetical protein
MRRHAIRRGQVRPDENGQLFAPLGSHKSRCRDTRRHLPVGAWFFLGHALRGTVLDAARVGESLPVY